MEDLGDKGGIGTLGLSVNSYMLGCLAVKTTYILFMKYCTQLRCQATHKSFQLIHDICSCIATPSPIPILSRPAQSVMPPFPLKPIDLCTKSLVLTASRY